MPRSGGISPFFSLFFNRFCLFFDRKYAFFARNAGFSSEYRIYMYFIRLNGPWVRHCRTKANFYSDIFHVSFISLLNMPVILLETLIEAPIERVFDLARSIDLHAETMSTSREQAVAGVIDGLIGLNETVTWEAVHFGIRQRLTSRITICERPAHLQDIMVRGAFVGFTHDHYFSRTETGTLMKDSFDYTSPLWTLGKVADALFLKRYMTSLLAERNRLIKLTAESGAWKRFIPEGESASG